MFEGEALQSAFPMFGGAMGVRPLGDNEVLWYERIKNSFLYPPAGIFANPPTATEGAQLPKPRPLRGVTSVGKEILYLSSEESIGSSNEELSSWSNIFAGEKKKSNATASKSSGSAGSRAPESGTTPSSLHEEDEEEEVEEEGTRLVTRKRSCEETTVGDTPPAQKAAATQPIGKQGRLRSLYKFSPEVLKKAAEKVKVHELKKAKEPELKETKFVTIPPKTNTEKEAEKRVEESVGDVIPEK
ncbi:hypothetical protein Hanom_Chr11g01013131 [Helianthus anomalus]